jgi:dTDP-4-dehydrorhamnose reductase
MLEKAQTGDALTLVDAETGCPTYTPHLAQKILEMIEGGEVSGTYHIVNEGAGVTWYGFGEEIFRVAGLHPQVTPVSGDAFPRKAKRPHAVVLQNTKTAKLPERIKALEEYVKKRGQ